MIDTTTWKVGGNTSANTINAIPATAYQNEIVNPKITATTDKASDYEAKIGLMYVSDYGFAADPSAWKTTLYNYNESVNGSAIRAQNWIYMGFTDWLITRQAIGSQGVFAIRKEGNVETLSLMSAMGIRPVFNLKTSVVYVTGDGTKYSPMRIQS